MGSMATWKRSRSSGSVTNDISHLCIQTDPNLFTGSVVVLWVWTFWRTITTLHCLLASVATALATTVAVDRTTIGGAIDVHVTSHERNLLRLHSLYLVGHRDRASTQGVRTWNRGARILVPKEPKLNQRGAIYCLCTHLFPTMQGNFDQTSAAQAERCSWKATQRCTEATTHTPSGG